MTVQEWTWFYVFIAISAFAASRIGRKDDRFSWPRAIVTFVVAFLGLLLLAWILALLSFVVSN